MKTPEEEPQQTVYANPIEALADKQLWEPPPPLPPPPSSSSPPPPPPPPPEPPTEKEEKYNPKWGLYSFIILIVAIGIILIVAIGWYVVNRTNFQSVANTGTDSRLGQLFFNCSGESTSLAEYDGRSLSNPQFEKSTASLMLNEVKQALSFKPSGDIIDTNFVKDPDDVAHRLTCWEINERSVKQEIRLRLSYHNRQCGDVWSDETSLHFNMVDSHHYDMNDYANREERWNGTLDRVTGHLQVNLWVETSKPKAWSKTDWSLTCKKVDKLVDAK